MAAHYGIDKCLVLRTKVYYATLDDAGSWSIEVESVDDPDSLPIFVEAAKLVIATGLTSEPRLPKLLGYADFQRPIVHSKQLKAHMANFGSYKDVVVLGGNKSAWDACYGAAMVGCHVHMVMRPAGGGPSYLWPQFFSWGPFRHVSLGMISATRLFTLFDPTLHGERGPFSWFRSLLHRSYLGQVMCRWMWTCLDMHIRKLNGFHDQRLSKLEPWATPFWVGNSLSIHNYDTNWFELVRQGHVTVHISEVEHLSRNTVHLASGETLAADTLICCTGWKAEPFVRFEPAHFSSYIKLDTKSSDAVEQTRAATQDLYRQRSYLSTLPHRTANAPPVPTEVTKNAPPPIYQLYRMVVPCRQDLLTTQSLAFIGLHASVHTVMVAQAQALWITAYFKDKIEHLSPSRISPDAITYNATLQTAYEQLRRPKDTGGAAGRYPDLVFDSLPYIDTLLRDLNLNPRRKKNIWNELVQPYRPADYAGLVDEWLQKNT